MESNGISLPFQCVTLSVTLMIILFLILGQIKYFCSIDLRPALFPLNSVAASSLHAPAKVKVGMTITDFPEFNMRANKIKMTGVIWFAFDPAKISLETVEKFSFLSSEIKQKRLMSVTQEAGLTVALYAIRVSFKSNLNYSFFPFEDHTLYFSLVNDAVKPQELIFEATDKDLIMGGDVYVSGWSYETHRVTSGYGATTLSRVIDSRVNDQRDNPSTGADSTVPSAHAQVKKIAGATSASTTKPAVADTTSAKKQITFPQLLFEMDFVHYSARYIIIIILPLLVVFCIDMFSLCLDQRQDHGVLVQIGTGNIVALVAYLFVVESIAPKVGYPMLSDFLFFLFLTTSLVTFITNAMGPKLTKTHKKMVSCALQIVVVSVFGYLCLVWIPC